MKWTGYRGYCGYRGSDPTRHEPLRVLSLERRPDPVPEGAWPGGPSAGSVEVGFGDVGIPGDVASVVVSCCGKGLPHVMRYNGCLAPQDVAEAVEMALAALAATE